MTKHAVSYKSTSALRGGYWAPLWLHFWFYLVCRRQERFRNKAFGPAFAAESGMGAMLALPCMFLVMTIDHYVPVLKMLAREWVAFALPGTPRLVWSVMIGCVAFIVGYGIMSFLLHAQRDRIMHKFYPYSKSNKILLPLFILFVPWVVIIFSSYRGIAAWLSSSQESDLALIWILVIVGVLLATEILFRLRWRLWVSINFANDKRNEGD